MNPFQSTPLKLGLDFVQDHLSVEYRASEKPQTLVIEANIGFPIASGGPTSMLWFERAMCAGAAGGAEFSPVVGSAEHVSGPLKSTDDGRFGPNYRWEMRVTAVSPFFLRNIVTRLGTIGANAKTTSARIKGSLPLDDSPLSVREATVIRWLDDPQAFMKAWADPGFPVKMTEGTTRAARTRVRFKGAVDKKLVDKLELALGIWQVTIDNYPSLDLSRRGHAQAIAHTARTKSEVVCTHAEFDYAREPAQAVLVNMLAYFHAKVAPIAEAEITLPVD